MNKYSDKSNFEINKAVAGILKLNTITCDRTKIVLFDDAQATPFDPCSNPSDAWPIILKNEISINFRGPVDSGAVAGEFGWTEAYAIHKNPLRAAMEVFLMINSTDDK
ncbi:MAG TPA: hypothetical protein DIT05_14565 [Morganella sp. (in: Bacteria)]|nr:hypothetical protein [Morganella sp. (in: enterobacteria)]